MIEITQPDDFHHHLRDGEGLKDVTVFAAKAFGRVVAMPNLNPPVRTLSDALAYRARILSHLPEDTDFTPLMTLYLTGEHHTILYTYCILYTVHVLYVLLLPIIYVQTSPP
ncbi:hypothetical protein B484DRAFT_258458 [Ochromonadaceae sp. CCMP2298]|nr:hypothetical protein B484DRAFT_258458 [Ochromonadaceae sp. CCMP2298]